MGSEDFGSKDLGLRSWDGQKLDGWNLAAWKLKWMDGSYVPTKIVSSLKILTWNAPFEKKATHLIFMIMNDFSFV